MRIRSLNSTILTMVVVMAMTAPAASAQVTAGVMGGVNLANIDFTAQDFTVNFQRRTGAIGGVFVRYDFREGVGLQIEGLFSQKGTKTDELDFDGDGSSDDFDVLVNYLEVPVLVHFGIKAGDTATIRVFGGSAFAVRISEQQKVNGVEVDESVGIKKSDVGITVGGGFDIRKFIMDVRYTFGVLNINDEDDADVVTIKNRTFSVLVGFRFR